MPQSGCTSSFSSFLSCIVVLGHAVLKCTTCACTGMAGSGKTTLLQRIASHLQESGEAGYILNLDPAVADVPYGANVDIRDTVSTASAAHAA